METKRHPVNLKQYRKVSGKWQFVPVARDAKGAPDPRLVVIDGEPISSKGGTFYLEFKHHGKRRQESIGTVPREALEAWRTKCAVLSGLIEPEEEPEEVVSGLDDRAGNRKVPDRGAGHERRENLPAVSQ